MKLAPDSHHETAKIVLALFVFLVAFGIFLLFINYKDNIIASDSMRLFVTMAIIAGGFLIGLLYLANSPQKKYLKAKTNHHKTAKSSKKKSGRKK